MPASTRTSPPSCSPGCTATTRPSSSRRCSTCSSPWATGGADGAATRTQLSNDGGIDGIIDQDALGLSRVYVQAKRYALATAVGRPEIQGFVGALHGQAANQGVFITTGRFSAGAREYAEGVATRVVLIDGQRLAALMIRYGVGVQVKRSVRIVEVDEDFFE